LGARVVAGRNIFLRRNHICLLSLLVFLSVVSIRWWVVADGCRGDWRMVAINGG